MIEIGKYKKILEEGLLLDHYVLLCNIKEGRELLKSKRIQGFINLMCKKGYIEDGIVTEKAIKLIDSEPVVIGFLKSKVEFVKDEEAGKAGNGERFDYAEWVIQLHRKCQARLKEKTGKGQIRDKIDGKPYPFLPNSTDLGKAILRAVNMYKLKDFDRIERTILSYVDRCIKANKWFPILGYYIIKNNMSTMVTDMESTEKEEGDDNNASIHIV